MKRRTTALILILALLLFCFPTPAGSEGASAKVPRLVAFTSVYLRTLKTMAPDIAFELLPNGTIQATLPDDGQVTLSVQNAYQEYVNGNNSMQAVAEHYAEASLSAFLADERPELSTENLFPVVKPQWYIEMLEENGVTPVYDPLIEGLVALFVLDTPTAIRPINENELDGLDVPREALLELALSNLLASIPSPQVSDYEGIGILEVDGMFEASLLLGDFGAMADFDVDGDLIIALPDRSPLYFVGSNDTDAIALLAGFAQAVYPDAAYPITDRLLRWTPEGLSWYE